MMKLHYVLMLAACAMLVGCSNQDGEAESANQPIRLELQGGANGGAETLLTVCQGQKTLFAYQPIHAVGMMKKSNVPAGKTLQAECAPIDGKLQYEDCLLDLKGDGVARYLIVDDHEENGVAPHNGWLIDVQDGFAIVGQVPAGEICEYPLPNPELIFEFVDTVKIFENQQPANVSVPLKVVKGSDPVLAMPDNAAMPLRFNPAKYRNLAKEQGIYTLYCDLMSKGQFAKAPSVAKFIGFTDAELKQYGEPCLEQIKQSKLYPYLVKLNAEPVAEQVAGSNP